MFGEWEPPSVKADDDVIQPLGVYDAVDGTTTRSDDWERIVTNVNESLEP